MREYDVIVVGAGHAGCEAALACSRMGFSVLMFTMDLDSIAKMPCNPAIGGLAKGHIVREIDALGGEMGKVTDMTGIQFRMLNKSSGPAVWAPRAQVDRRAYSFEFKKVIERQENLEIKQGMVTKLKTQNSPIGVRASDIGVLRTKLKTKITGVVTQTGTEYDARAVILTTGTFLNGLVHIGLESFPAGRAGEFPALGISESLKELGFQLGRLKTGTSPRLDGKTIDFSELSVQCGDESPSPFSFQTKDFCPKQVPCYITYTNEETHKIIYKNLDRSPLYTKRIKGTGPRYCPSIEDKVVRFRDRDRHQVFLEPDGKYTDEYYLNGVSTSLPEDVQVKMLRTIHGLENVEILRPGYAIEYDFVFPTQLYPSLETKLVENLFLAGQINGTSGYEEAGGQGIIAGINACLKLRGEEPFVLRRDEAYIGVLIDDLVTKGTDEPYRMFTSRAEYRLLLRQDNADERLMPFGYEFGLISAEVFSYLRNKVKDREREIERLNKTRVKPEDVNFLLREWKTSEITEETTLSQLLKRPEITYEGLLLIDQYREEFPEDVKKQVEMFIKYDGYIKRQIEQAEKLKRLDERKIPEEIDYNAMVGLSNEAKQKLLSIRPQTIGQASRISGVNPSDISIILIYIEKAWRERRKEKASRNLINQTPEIEEEIDEF